MEYLEILLQDVNKKYLDLVIRKELKIDNDKVISSHFYDTVNKVDKEYGDTFSLIDYFELPNTANIYAKQVELGEILTNVMVIMSFDEELGDITINFREEEICDCDINELKLKIISISNKLLEIQKKYNIKKIRLGYESLISDENVILSISCGHVEIANRFKGKLNDAVELAYR